MKHTRECGCEVDGCTIEKFCAKRFGCWVVYLDQRHPTLSWLLPGIIGFLLGVCLLSPLVFR